MSLDLYIPLGFWPWLLALVSTLVALAYLATHIEYQVGQRCLKDGLDRCCLHPGHQGECLIQPLVINSPTKRNTHA